MRTHNSNGIIDKKDSANTQRGIIINAPIRSKSTQKRQTVHATQGYKTKYRKDLDDRRPFRGVGWCWDGWVPAEFWSLWLRSLETISYDMKMISYSFIHRNHQENDSLWQLISIFYFILRRWWTAIRMLILNRQLNSMIYILREWKSSLQLIILCLKMYFERFRVLKK